MASVPTSTLVPVDVYLNSSYEHDLEYVDGQLIERGMPTIPHSFFQLLLGAHFLRFAKAFGFLPMTEARTQIVARARYRIPDLLLCARPVPADKRFVNTPPLAVFEILSPDDRLSDQLVRFADFARIGVRYVILLDPEELKAFRFVDGSLIETEFTVLDLPAGPVPFDSEALFRELVENLGEV